MRLSKSDIFFTIVCLGIISISSAMIISNFQARGTGTGKPIGYVVMKKKVAKRKFSNDTVWSQVDIKSDLYNYDTLLTEPDSLAVVHLNDGTELTLEEKSLIVLSKKQQGYTINFKDGNITAVKKKGSISPGEVLISLGDTNKTVKIDDGDVSLKKKDDVTTLNVAKGEVEIDTEEGTQKVDNKKLVAIKAASIETSEKLVQLKSPSNQGYFVAVRSQINVTFSWSVTENKESVIEISRDRAFGQRLLSQKTARQTLSTNLVPGTYYWRVRIPGKKPASEIRAVTIVKEEPMRLLEPINGYIFRYRESFPEIRFNWTGCINAPYYEIEVSKDKTFRSGSFVIRSVARSITTSQIKDGIYYWRVKAYYPHSAIGPLVSNRNSLIVRKKKAYSRPVVVTPQKNEQISYIMLDNGKLFFSWKGDDEMTAYDVLIAGDKAFANSITKTRTSNSYYTVGKDLKPGKYFLKVAGITPDKSRIESVVIPFAIVEAKYLKLNYPANGTIATVAGSTQLSFNWFDPNFGNKYLIEISEDKGFKKLLTKKTIRKRNAVFTIDDSQTGKKYWRVVLLSSKDQKLSQSKVNTFTLVKHLESPVGIYPVNNRIVNMNSKNNIQFKWKAVEGATSYRFNLYHIRGRDVKKVYSKIINRNSYNLKNLSLLDTGRFSWNVEAQNRKTARVKAVSKSESYLFTITLTDNLDAPTIEAPEVIFVK